MAQINHITLLRSGEVLTLDKLNSMKPHTVFQMGKVKLPEVEEEVRWIAKTGGVNDWAIYYGPGSLPIQKIADEGTKQYNKVIIESLVKCEAEAYNQYRK